MYEARELLRRGHRVHVLRPGLGPLGLRPRLPRRGRLAQLVGRVRRAGGGGGRAIRAPAATRASGDVSRPGVRLERRLGELRAERSRGARRSAGSPPRLPNHQSSNGATSPAQPWTNRHSTPGQLGLDRRAQRCRVLGVPLGGDAADRDRVGGEVDDGRERRAAGVVDADHRHRVVDRPLVLHAVDAEPGRARRRPRRRAPAAAAPCAAKTAPETQVGEHRGVAPRTRPRPGDRRRPIRARGSARCGCALAWTSTASAGSRSAPGRARGRRPSGRGRRRRGPSSTSAAVRSPSESTSACATSGSRAPRARQRRAAQQPTGSPSGGVMSTRATPAVQAQ